MSEIIVGIDLGTSTTEAAVIRDGKPVMLLNLEGEISTPSAVGIDDAGNFVIGEKARAQYMLSPERTAIEIKRHMGTEDKIGLGRQEYTPIDLSARLLEYVKTYVSEAMEEEISRAVISVPAYFDDIQRQATVFAGQRAGFRVERILNEPTAAALSYGLEHLEEESHILVYDLGGGTFDVTLLEMFDGVREVKASSGDNKLGGKDFDEKLMDYLAERFQKKYSVDLRSDVYASVRLKEEAEQCKKSLSTEESYHVLVPMIVEKDGSPLALDENVTREEFEELCAELLERTHVPMDVVLEDADISTEDIDQVILVGGSTRMPCVSKDIEKYLGIVPQRSVNPDFAVAEGAAIQAGIIEGSIRTEDSIIMTDVNPYTLGVRCLHEFTDDYMSVIIPRNVTIPTSRTETYYTSSDDQSVAAIEVYQGESSYASSNHFLGKFNVTGIPKKPAGAEQIQVEFTYNLNGMLEVRASIVSTGKEAGIRIDMMHEEAEEEKDLSGWKDVPEAKAFRTVVRRAEKRMKAAEKNGEEDLKKSLEISLNLLKTALLDGKISHAESIGEELLGLLED